MDLLMDYRFKTLLQQRNLHFLGRSVDLNRVITQKIDVKIGESLQYAIDSFQAGGISKILVRRAQFIIRIMNHTNIRGMHYILRNAYFYLRKTWWS